MGVAGLLSGLLSGYSSAMISKHREERDREDKQAQAELSVLQTAVQTGKLTPEAQSAAFERMEEIVQDYGGKKAGFSFKNLLGEFSDTTQKKGGAASQPGQAGGAPQPKAGATGAAPSSNVNLGAVPSRRSPFQFRSDADIAAEQADEQTQAKIKDIHAQMSSLSQYFYGKPLDQLNPQEKQRVAQFVYRLPDAKVHPITILGSDGKSPTPALQADDGTVIDSSGAIVSNPVEWKAPKNMESRVNIGPGGKLQPVWVNPETHEVIDANTGEKVDKPNLAPPSGYMPTSSTTTTVQPSQAVDPKTGQVVVGPAVTSQSTTVHNKGNAGIPIPSRPTAPQKQSTDTKPQSKAQVLPWAEPKNLGTQMSQSATTFRQGVTTANKQVADAQKKLDALLKEQRGAGVVKQVEQGVGLSGVPDVGAATKALHAAKEKAKNAQKASQYFEAMRQSILDGTADLGTVTKIAQDLADYGYTTTAPPNVTRTAN